MIDRELDKGGKFRSIDEDKGERNDGRFLAMPNSRRAKWPPRRKILRELHSVLRSLANRIRAGSSKWKSGPPARSGYNQINVAIALRDERHGGPDLSSPDDACLLKGHNYSI